MSACKRSRSLGAFDKRRATWHGHGLPRLGTRPDASLSNALVSRSRTRPIQRSSSHASLSDALSSSRPKPLQRSSSHASISDASTCFELEPSNLKTTAGVSSGLGRAQRLQMDSSSPYMISGVACAARAATASERRQPSASTSICFTACVHRYPIGCPLELALQANGWTIKFDDEAAEKWGLRWGRTSDIHKEIFANPRCSSLQGQIRLVNHFCRDRIKIFNSKRNFWKCLQTTHNHADLFSFAPRCYDMQRVDQRQAFVADFVTSAAEAVATSSSDESSLSVALDVLRSPQSCKDDKRARQQAIVLSQVLTSQSVERGLQADTQLSIEARSTVQERSKDPLRQAHMSSSQNLWLVKRVGQENGKGVRVDSQLSQLLGIAAEFRFDCMAQKYMERPLMPQGRKMDLRIWMLVSSWNPMHAWLWAEPYARLASKPMNFDIGELHDPLVHLTNRSQQKKAPGLNGQVDPKRVSDDTSLPCWTLPRLVQWLEGPAGFKKGTWHSQVWPRLVAVAQKVTKSLEAIPGKEPPSDIRCFEVIGLDMMLDRELRPWFLEANSTPDLCHDADPELQDVIRRCLTSAVALVMRAQSSDWLPGVAEVDSSVSGVPVPGSDSWRMIAHKGQTH